MRRLNLEHLVVLGSVILCRHLACLGAASPEQEVRGWEESAAVCRSRRAACKEEMSVDEAAAILRSFRTKQQPAANHADADEVPAPRKRPNNQKGQAPVKSPLNASHTNAQCLCAMVLFAC